MAQRSPALTTHATPNVKFPVANSEDLSGYLSPYGKDSSIGVVVIQEWWGMNESIQHTTDEFGQAGFRALVPDLYRGAVAKDHEHAGHLLNGLDWGRAWTDIQGAAKYLLSQGCKKVGVVGFCMGGALTIAASQAPEVSATVPFYGCPDLSHVNTKNISGPMQAHFGENDDMKGFADPDTARKLEKFMKDGGVKFELVVHKGCGHAFTNTDRPETVNPTERASAFKSAFEFFKKHLA